MAYQRAERIFDIKDGDALHIVDFERNLLHFGYAKSLGIPKKLMPFEYVDRKFYLEGGSLSPKDPNMMLRDLTLGTPSTLEFMLSGLIVRPEMIAQYQPRREVRQLIEKIASLGEAVQEDYPIRMPVPSVESFVINEETFQDPNLDLYVLPPDPYSATLGRISHASVLLQNRFKKKIPLNLIIKAIEDI